MVKPQGWGGRGAGRRGRKGVEKVVGEEHFKNEKPNPLFVSVCVAVVSLSLHLPTHLPKTSF